MTSKLRYDNVLAYMVERNEINEQNLGDLLDEAFERIKGNEVGQLLREQVESILDTLSGRERQVLRERFGLVDGRFKTQTRVGELIGRSRWTVSRIERNALNKLRVPTLHIPHLPQGL